MFVTYGIIETGHSLITLLLRLNYMVTEYINKYPKGHRSICVRMGHLERRAIDLAPTETRPIPSRVSCNIKV